MKFASVVLWTVLLGRVDGFQPLISNGRPVLLKHTPMSRTEVTSPSLRMAPQDGDSNKNSTEGAPPQPPAVDPAVEAQKRLIEGKARAAQAQKLTESAWSAASGLLLGSVVGEVLSVQIPDLVDLAGGNGIVPPLVTGALLGGAAFAGASSDSPASPIIRNTLGKTLQALGGAAGNAARGAADSAVSYVASVPEKVAQAAKEKAKATADEIARIPDKVKDAAKEKAEDIADEIASIPDKVTVAARDKAQKTADNIAKIPDKVKQAAKEKAEDIADEIASIPDKVSAAAKEKAQETAEDIARIPDKVAQSAKEKATEIVAEVKATPGRVAESTKRAVEETVKDTVVKAEEAIADVIPFDTTPKQPEPPKAPPPPAEETGESVLPQLPKVELPTFDRPKPPQPPKAPPKEEPPSFELPKVGLPKISKPPQVPLKKEKDDFVFSEVSLKDFVSQVKSSEETGVDRAQQKKQAEQQRKKEQQRVEATRKATEAAQAADEKRKAADADRKAAAARAADERLAKSRAAAAAKKTAAEEKRAAAEAAAEEREQKRLEAESRRQEAEEKRVAAQAARQERGSTRPSQARPTLSLTSLFGLEQTEEVEATPPGKEIRAAPRGVPTVASWRQNGDGSITGRISGSPSFDDGDTITTSPIRGDPGEGIIVQTGSGSKYYLATKATGGLFNLFGGAPAAKESKTTRAKQARESTETAQPRSTFSLSALFGSEASDDDVDDDEEPSRPKTQPRKVSAAPRGVPTIVNWRQNRDGSISGKISGSRSFQEGETVTTSPVGGDAVDGVVVSTSSGSKYYLAEKSSGGGFQSLFGAPAAPSSSNAEAEATAQRERKAKEARQAKAEAERAIEQRRREAQRKQKESASAAEAQRREAEAAAQKRRQDADQRRAEAAAAAEAKRKEAQTKRAAATRVTTDTPPARPRATFSLFGAGQPKVAPASSSPAPNQPTKKVATAPRGVPTIASWRQNRDGSISGRISGSPSFEDGEGITTSPIVGNVEVGAIVKTSSGSRYFLADKGGFNLFGGGSPAPAPAPAQAMSSAEKAAEQRRKKIEENKKVALAAAEARRREAEEKRAAAAAEAQAKRVAAEAKKAAAAKARQPAKEVPSVGAARPTITLFSGGPASAPPKSAVAPRGVPTIVAWRKRFDGGITGKIYGSPSFDDGEKIETSPIVSGDLENGSVVKTGSGSRYFLSPNKTMKATNKKKVLQDLASAKPGSTIRLTKEQKDIEAKEAKSARKTFSLFGLGGDSSANSPPQSTPSGKKAPRGVPTINRWKENGDGSVTGFITGSSNFSEGERVTTSPISSGTVSSGEVVRTGSGSRYFLA